MEMCDSALPGGNPPPAPAWHVNPGVPVGWVDNCAYNGTMGIVESGPAAAQAAWAETGVPGTPWGFVETLTMTGGSANLGPGNNHTYAFEEGWPAANLGETQRTWLVATKPPTPFAFPFEKYNPPSGGAGFSVHWNCDGNYQPGCGAGPTVWVGHLAATEVDVKPPAVKVEGTILAGGILRGHQTISASATDVGGGLTKIEVLINGLPVSSPMTASCALGSVNSSVAQGTVALSPTPCPSSLANVWSLDTGAPPFHEGTNTVQVCASDFATIGEPNRTCSTPASITVDDSCVESAVAGGEVLSAQFAGNHQEDVTKRYGKGATITGELSNQAGDAIGGATVCVQAQQEGEAALTPVGTATTDGAGHFSYVVPPGPNRKLLLGYRHDSFQVARSVGFYSHTRPTIKITPGKVDNGDTIRISGKVPGGTSAAGRVVTLKASAPHSKKWYPFGETTTDGNGEYHLKYRFAKTTRKTIYRMESTVLKQDHFPWEAGHSKPAFVVVEK
jgi:hypothetical protein